VHSANEFVLEIPGINLQIADMGILPATIREAGSTPLINTTN